MLQWWRAVDNAVSDLTDPRFEPETSRSKDERVIPLVQQTGFSNLCSFPILQLPVPLPVLETWESVCSSQKCKISMQTTFNNRFSKFKNRFARTGADKLNSMTVNNHTVTEITRKTRQNFKAAHLNYRDISIMEFVELMIHDRTFEASSLCLLLSSAQLRYDVHGYPLRSYFLVKFEKM